MKYSIKLTYPDGEYAYLTYRNKTSWCLRTAKKHMSTMRLWPAIKAEIVEA